MLAAETVEGEKEWATKKIEKLIDEIGYLTDPLEIEAKLYEVYITARRGYSVIHLINRKVK